MEIFVQGEIAAKADDVWDFVGDFAGVMRWHPQIVQCNALGVGIGMIRTAKFAEWWIAERLDRHEPLRKVVGYTVVDSSRQDAVGSSGSIELLSDQNHGTLLRWHARLPLATSATQYDVMVAYYRLRISHLRAALGVVTCSS